LEQRNNTPSSTGTSDSTTRLPTTLDESTLSRLVAARLDLPASQRLLSSNFKLSIIKRCWEDQLKNKRMPVSLSFVRPYDNG
jgi:hypothetical protein